MAQEFVSPIFIVGTGRCGSTVLHHMMAEHPHVSFLTNVLSKYPHSPALHRAALKGHKFRLTPALIRRRILPSEAWSFWEHMIPGFSTPYRDLTAEDVTPRAYERIRQCLSEILLPDAPHLLLKLTGWTRIGLIKSVFPDAVIIHILRDPRAVVNSLLHVSWWHGWMGPAAWRWGPLTSDEEKVWKSLDESFVALAAIEWIRILRAYRSSLQILPLEMRDSIIEIDYKGLCDDAPSTIEQLLSKCQLSPSTEFQRRVSKYELNSQDDKWKQDLNPSQQRTLESALKQLEWERYRSAVSETGWDTHQVEGLAFD